MYKELEKKIIDHARSEYPKEACGLIYLKGLIELDYAPCRNTTGDDPTESFVVHEDDYLETESKGRILGLVHSHPDALPEPTQLDLDVCRFNGLDCIIVGFPNGKDGEPVFFKKGFIREDLDYERRPFLHGIVDCYTLLRDWYWRERKIDLPDFYRPDQWWDHEPKLAFYSERFTEAGFGLVMKRPQARDLVGLEVGDVLIAHVHSDTPNHAMIMIDPVRNEILHHPYGALSKKELYGVYYRHRTTHWLRYGYVA